jgi:hypothetical protein
MASNLGEAEVKRMEENRRLAKEKRINVEIAKACRSCLSEVIAKVCLSETREANKNREAMFAQMGQRDIVRRRQEAQIMAEMDDISDRIACAALEDIEAAELVHFRILTKSDIDVALTLILWFAQADFEAPTQVEAESNSNVSVQVS